MNMPIDIKSGATVKDLKDRLAQLPDDAKVEFIANSGSIFHALNDFCSKAGVDISKHNDAAQRCVNDVAFSIYAGGQKIAAC